MADAPFQLEQCIERRRRQWLQVRLLCGKRLCDDLLRRGMLAHIGGRCEPVLQLRVQVIEIAERSRRKKSLRI